MQQNSFSRLLQTTEIFANCGKKKCKKERGKKKKNPVFYGSFRYFPVFPVLSGTSKRKEHIPTKK
jgi:hypothetical protein